LTGHCRHAAYENAEGEVIKFGLCSEKCFPDEQSAGQVGACCIENSDCDTQKCDSGRCGSHCELVNLYTVKRTGGDCCDINVHCASGQCGLNFECISGPSIDIDFGTSISKDGTLDYLDDLINGSNDLLDDLNDLIPTPLTNSKDPFRSGGDEEPDQRYAIIYEAEKEFDEEHNPMFALWTRLVISVISLIAATVIYNVVAKWYQRSGSVSAMFKCAKKQKSKESSVPV